MQMQCEIISQDRIVFQGDVEKISLPGVDGVAGVLPKHTPLLMVLKYGIITITREGREQYFTVAGGFAEVQPDFTTILADAAENVNEINIQRAEEARKRAERMLEEGLGDDQDSYLKIMAALKRSNLRLNAAKRYNEKIS
ncbi:MAG: ATP synthase F1 subunit epsilon [Anaerolineaceae bacterium]|nr:ATP synthase F1 subunit epsilon [Anaerolineaceae bacterium]